MMGVHVQGPQIYIVLCVSIWGRRISCNFYCDGAPQKPCADDENIQKPTDESNNMPIVCPKCGGKKIDGTCVVCSERVGVDGTKALHTFADRRVLCDKPQTRTTR